MEETVDTRALVHTVKDLCRVCYTCVRECPVKAIRIVDGQAEVVPERCIVASMLKKLGFGRVFEVGMGADLVAKAYETHINNDPQIC